MKAFLWGSQDNQANILENFQKQMINTDFGLGFLIFFGNSLHGLIPNTVAFKQKKPKKA